MPSGRQLECFNAWNEAWTLLPADVERSGIFRRAGEANAAVAGFRTDKALAVFERQRGNTVWVAVINPGEGFGLRWAAGWVPGQARRLAGVWLVNGRRDPRQPIQVSFALPDPIDSDRRGLEHSLERSRRIEPDSVRVARRSTSST